MGSSTGEVKNQCYLFCLESLLATQLSSMHESRLVTIKIANRDNSSPTAQSVLEGKVWPT